MSFYILLALILLILAVVVYLLFTVIFHKTPETATWHNPFYSKKNGKYIYAGVYELQTTGENFTPLDDAHPYATDENFVFLKSEIIPGADPKTFRYVGKGQRKMYGKDAYSVFFEMKKIEGAIPASFQILHGSGFVKDENSVFFDGNKIPEADAKTFHIMEGEYAKDSQRYFLRRTPILPEQVPKAVLMGAKIDV